MEIQPVLTALPFVAGLAHEDIGRIAAVAFRRDVRRREPVYLEGEDPAGFYLVETGWVKVSRSSASGKSVLLDVIGPGQVIGLCCGSLFGPHACTAHALVPSTIIWIRGPTWQSLLNEIPRLRLAAVESLLSSRRRCADLAFEMAVQDVEGRLAALLLKLSAIDTGAVSSKKEALHLLSQQELADAIGTAREVVTRHVSKLVEKGVLKRAGRRILVERPDELRQIVARA